jgi:predicted RNA-binding Zn-ribbon protein involved in translation (DUF1610 family)
MSEDLMLDAQCPRCGLVELDRDQVWLVLASEATMTHYAFACPGCGEVVRHHADDVIVDVLVPLLAVETLDVPAEALEVRAGPALTTDDLIDFCLALDALDSPDSLDTAAPAPAR